jgi:hypothetical protein
MTNHLHAWRFNTKRRALVKAVSFSAVVLLVSGCAGAANVVIPESLKAPCVSTVDVSTAQTVGDLGRAIVAQDGDLRVCDVKREAIVAIAESQNRRWWWPF